MNRAERRKIWLLTCPGLLFLGIFFLAPITLLVIASFKIDGTWTIAAYVDTLSRPFYTVALFRTLRVGLIVTAVAAAVGYPTAYVISKMSPKKKAAFMSISMFPLMTNAVVRTLAWFIILGRHGAVNRLLAILGLSAQPIRFLHTEGAIIIGLTHLFFPLMLLSLISALENIPPDVEEAAQSLGAHPLRAFLRIIFPLSADGLVVGGTLVFTGSITAYATPAILGGTRVLTLATLLQQRAIALFDWGTATVVAVSLLLITVVVNLVLRRLRLRAAE